MISLSGKKIILEIKIEMKIMKYIVNAHLTVIPHRVYPLRSYLLY